MYFLKKSSIADLLKEPIPEDIFYSGINVLDHYKEYELFLTKNSLEELFSHGELNDKADKLKSKLDYHKASIKAIHSPESLFLTSADKNGGSSTNYLSLDEVLCGSCREESLELLKKMIYLAEAFSSEESPVTVILHGGSVNGCSSEYELPQPDDQALERLEKELVGLSIKQPVKIAVENVTPYVDGNGSMPKGKNGGWGESYLEYIDVLKKLNGKLNGKISFGLCVDFCHLIADFRIMREECFGAKSCCEYIKSFMERLAEKLIKTNQYSEKQQQIKPLLFHVSMLEEDGSHGGLFRYGNDSDGEILETVRSICAKYPDVPITLEMADGIDIDKACVNFDRMMYTFSVIHKSGYLGNMLGSDDCCELKEFFEDLFMLYTVPWTNMARIQELLWRVKQYVVKNTPTQETRECAAVGGIAGIFGFTRDEDEVNTALFRLKAYIVYTRFCNLGEYLAEVYGKADFLSNKEKDFMLSMKYFMFCDDEIKQCVYTGVGYTFNVDFLPKRVESVYRFYDDIDERTITSFEPQPNMESHCFGQMVEGVREQIIGTKPLKMLSCGKNFFPCLMKYYQAPRENHFTLRIYKNMPVNFVEPENGEKLSVPAFLQKYCYMEKKYPKKLDFAIDVSLFRNGRGGEKDASDTGTLAGFISTVGCTRNEISYTKVGSIADGEIVATKLPDSNTDMYTFGNDTALALAQACMEHDEKAAPIKSISITDKNGKRDLDGNTVNKIENIIAYVRVTNEEKSETYNSYYAQDIYDKSMLLPNLYKDTKIKIERREDV